jgi:hypothetical protein
MKTIKLITGQTYRNTLSGESVTLLYIRDDPVHGATAIVRPLDNITGGDRTYGINLHRLEELNEDDLDYMRRIPDLDLELIQRSVHTISHLRNDCWCDSEEGPPCHSCRKMITMQQELKSILTRRKQ